MLPSSAPSQADPPFGAGLVGDRHQLPFVALSSFLGVLADRDKIQ